VGLPDLHQGPTGVSVLAKAPIPKLPGPDIGCGMSLFVTDIQANLSIKKIVKRMERLNLEEGEDFDDPDLGTIGGGNHFAELQYIDDAVPLDPAFDTLLGPDARSKAFLMVHSGSRSHGSKLFAELGDGSDPERYMLEHVQLVEWAKKNRMEIARRFIEQFTGSASSAHPVPLIDIAHNWIENLPDNRGFLHRKGAAPSTPGSLSLLPGSRATASYVLVCNGDMERDLCSVAHGAGRRLSRSDARKQGRSLAAARSGGQREDLTRQGTILCTCKNLLLEEAPYAYKDVEGVVATMVDRGMCAVGARLLPMATYKTRREAADDHKR
jgi:release factor H-coupled RctB family protein